MFDIHGAFREKADALEKERATPQSFIKTIWYKDGPRYGVLTARNPRLVEVIRHGDKVTIVDRFGQQHSGKAVMRSATGGWVLNMGGRYGTPGLADDENITRVKPGKRNFRGNPRRHASQIFDTSTVEGLKKAERFKAKLEKDYDSVNVYAIGLTRVQIVGLRPRSEQPSNRGQNPVTAYGVVRGRDWQQEHYESKSGHARQRAAQLRKLGFKVTVVPMGSQITPQGRVTMTMVDIRGIADREVPAPDRVLRMNPMSVPEKHQLRIARETLKMSDAMAGVMGGPTKAEAREIIQRLEKKIRVTVAIRDR